MSSKRAAAGAPGDSDKEVKLARIADVLQMTLAEPLLYRGDLLPELWQAMVVNNLSVGDASRLMRILVQRGRYVGDLSERFHHWKWATFVELIKRDFDTPFEENRQTRSFGIAARFAKYLLPMTKMFNPRKAGQWDLPEVAYALASYARRAMVVAFNACLLLRKFMPNTGRPRHLFSLWSPAYILHNSENKPGLSAPLAPIGGKALNMMSQPLNRERNLHEQVLVLMDQEMSLNRLMQDSSLAQAFERVNHAYTNWRRTPEPDAAVEKQVAYEAEIARFREHPIFAALHDPKERQKIAAKFHPPHITVDLSIIDLANNPAAEGLHADGKRRITLGRVGEWHFTADPDEVAMQQMPPSAASRHVLVYNLIYRLGWKGYPLLHLRERHGIFLEHTPFDPTSFQGLAVRRRVTLERVDVEAFFAFLAEAGRPLPRPLMPDPSPVAPSAFGMLARCYKPIDIDSDEIVRSRDDLDDESFFQRKMRDGLRDLPHSDPAAISYIVPQTLRTHESNLLVRALHLALDDAADVTEAHGYALAQLMYSDAGRRELADVTTYYETVPDPRESGKYVRKVVLAARKKRLARQRQRRRDAGEDVDDDDEEEEEEEEQDPSRRRFIVLKANDPSGSPDGLGNDGLFH